ncbi:MAG: hypothetical protein PHV13_03075 [Candidatus ainarchaeum sp.]|nr:hypothetical protein [Candidatus ainarchaeum sp.]
MVSSTFAVRKHSTTLTVGTVPAHRIWTKHHHTGTQRIDAEKMLATGNAGQRKMAATLLGNLKSSSSYEPLLCALQRKNDDRGTKLAILQALHNVGERYGYMVEFSKGLAVLEQFIKSNLKDIRLVQMACQALQWAGTTDEITEATERITAAAGTRYPQAASAATSLYVDMINSH